MHIALLQVIASSLGYMLANYSNHLYYTDCQ